MLKTPSIQFPTIARSLSPILILAMMLVGNTLNPSPTIAQSPDVEIKQTEYVPKVAFRKAPRLLDIYTTFNTVRFRGATYYFDIVISQEGEVPLQKVEIEQRRGQDEIKYKLENTVAYLGTHRRKGDSLAIASVSQDEETKVITVEFANPLPPGTTFTVGLKPRRNPHFSGVYVFGVTAIPQGENPYGLYLGSRSLSFYSGYDRFFGH